MANSEQVKIIKGGFTAWNEWRKLHPEEEIDLSWEILSGLNLVETNLVEANLKGARLTSANLIEANLTRANLMQAYLDDALLLRANQTEAN